MFNIMKITVEKKYFPMAMYDVVVMALVERDEMKEQTLVYYTNGSDETFSVYGGYMECTDLVQSFEDRYECADSEYGKVFTILMNAAKMIDDEV